MKLNSWHFWGGAAIILWIGISISEPNLGFVPMVSAEAIGFNVGNLFLPILGAVLIYTGFKKGKKG